MFTHPGLRTALLAVTVGAALLLAGLLAACGGQPAPAPTQPPPTPPPAAPTNTAVPPSPTLAPATTAPTLAPTKAPTSAPTQVPVAAAPANADNCVKCHTSEETLRKLAKVEEPAEKLSEGEG